MTTQEKLDELQETLDMFADPSSRAELLIGFADKFQGVPPEIAARPYPRKRRVAERCAVGQQAHARERMYPRIDLRLA